MPKSFRGDSDFSDYAPVAERITSFYKQYPKGRIITRLHSRTEQEITFRALIYRELGDPAPSATGWASEREGDGDVNSVACMENTETSAIGRALANLGFTASTRRPSREEMEKAARARARMRYEPAHSDAGNRGSSEPTAEAAATLQARAETVTDLLSLLRAARHSGLRPARADSIDERIRGGHASDAMLDRIGRRLRRWIAASVRRHTTGLSISGDV